jgi:rubrerythrin
MTRAWRDNLDGSPDDDLPGDPACLLRRVCQQCGAVADSDPPTTCPQCRADMRAD